MTTAIYMKKIFISESPQQLARLNKSSYMGRLRTTYDKALKYSVYPNPKDREPNIFTEVGMVHIGNIWDKYSMHHHYTILLSYKRYKHT